MGEIEQQQITIKISIEKKNGSKKNLAIVCISLLGNIWEIL